jgi:hypothetical protein
VKASEDTQKAEVLSEQLKSSTARMGRAILATKRLRYVQSVAASKAEKALAVNKAIDAKQVDVVKAQTEVMDATHEAQEFEASGM